MFLVFQYLFTLCSLLIHYLLHITHFSPTKVHPHVYIPSPSRVATITAVSMRKVAADPGEFVPHVQTFRGAPCAAQ